MNDYYYKTDMRVKDYFNPHGKFFLDAGSGALPHAVYLEYSSGYERRVCVDLSTTGLLEAKSKLKEGGFYVNADLTKLPFKDGIFDSTVCAHVLYHIPEDEQKSAIFELYRTLGKNAPCVVIYKWPAHLLSKIASLYRRIIEKTKRIILMIPGIRNLLKKLMNEGRQAANEDQPSPPAHLTLYYKPHGYRWLQKTLPDQWVTDIHCWRSIDKRISETFVPDNRLGYFMLEFIFSLETRFSRALARIGRYPMIIIRKQ